MTENIRLTKTERIAKNPTAYGIRTTSSLKLAEKWALSGQMITSIILGDNNMYWVTPNRRIDNMLITTGYETV